MTGALTSGLMSPEIRKVVDRARREPEGRFHSLAHLLDVPALAAAYWSIRKDAAVGVDGVTKDQYGQDVEQNLQDLYARLRSKRYRHQPIRRVHIPKDGGRTRPIGISALEDKIVQSAVRHVLEAIYEQDFLDCSFGFRPGRNAHEAIRALDKVVFRGEVNWILEADIVSFFDSLDRTRLKEMLQVRVADGSLLRLIGKLLRVGVLDGALLHGATRLGIKNSRQPQLDNTLVLYLVGSSVPWLGQNDAGTRDSTPDCSQIVHGCVVSLLAPSRGGVASTATKKSDRPALRRRPTGRHCPRTVCPGRQPVPLEEGDGMMRDVSSVECSGTSTTGC